MADKEQYRHLASHEDMIERCYRCGLCRNTCPSFRESGIEGASPRGRIQLAKAALEGNLGFERMASDRMLDCLNCMRCADVCPAGVSAGEIVLAARADMVESGKLPLVKKLAFNTVLKHPALLGLASKLGAAGKKLFYDSSEVLTALLPRFIGMDDKKFPSPVTVQTMDRWPELVSPVQGKPVRRVGYFIGCATNLIYPGVADAVIRVLRHNGVEVVIPRGQACCGIPVYTSGDYANAEKLAKRNREVFAGLDIDCIVTDCGSCSAALKHEVEDYVGIKAFDVPVYDINEFLASEIELKKPGRDVNMRVSYHDPCHLRRGQGIWREPRALLSMVPGVDFVEMDDADYCCGGAGAFAYTHHSLSRKVGSAKVANIRKTGAGYVATPCPSCTMQIEDLLHHEGLEIRVIHPVCVLDMSYDYDEESTPEAAVQPEAAAGVN